MPNRNGPTNTKRQRERSIRERREKKEQRRAQRELDKKNGVVRVEEPEEFPPETAERTGVAEAG